MLHLHTHQPRIIHRDLTSFNVLVDKDWHCKVSDFGVSRTQHEHEQLSLQPGYMS